MEYIALKTPSGHSCTLTYYNEVTGWVVSLPDAAMNGQHAKVFLGRNVLVVGSLNVALADREQARIAYDFIGAVESCRNVL